jgi:hypothetical protein
MTDVRIDGFRDCAVAHLMMPSIGVIETDKQLRIGADAS